MHKALTYLSTLPDDTVVYNGHEYTAASVEFGSYVSLNSIFAFLALY